MINPTIRPLTDISGYDTRWGWDTQEKEARESRFAKRLRRASDKYTDDTLNSGDTLSFENPAFNILTGETSFIVAKIASDTGTH